jgi:hypothetical protein
MATIFPLTPQPNFINFTLPEISKSLEKFNTTDFTQKVYEQNFLGYQLSLDFNNLNFQQKIIIQDFYLQQEGRIFQFPLSYFDTRFPSTINNRLKRIKFWSFNGCNITPKILNDFRSTYNINILCSGCRG